MRKHVRVEQEGRAGVCHLARAVMLSTAPVCSLLRSLRFQYSLGAGQPFKLLKYRFNCTTWGEHVNSILSNRPKEKGDKDLQVLPNQTMISIFVGSKMRKWENPRKIHKIFPRVLLTLTNRESSYTASAVAYSRDCAEA